VPDAILASGYQKSASTGSKVSELVPRHAGLHLEGWLLTQNSSPTSSPPSANADNRMTEWTAARSTIERFDGYTSDLRKYGFTLVTGLLAVSGFLTSSPSVALSPGVKLGVILSIMVLVVTLSLLDCQYRFYAKCASVRARILERSLNLDLTNSIAFFKETSVFSDWITRIYIGFAAATFILGWAVIWGDGAQVLVLLVAFVLAWLIIYVTSLGKLTSVVDWSVDRKVVSAGDPVRITFTNLLDEKAPVDIYLECTVSGQDGMPPEPLGKESHELWYMGAGDWVWDTDKRLPGLYNIYCLWKIYDKAFKGVSREAKNRIKAVARPSKDQPQEGHYAHTHTIVVQVIKSQTSSNPLTPTKDDGLLPPSRGLAPQAQGQVKTGKKNVAIASETTAEENE